MKALELKARIDEDGHLVLAYPLALRNKNVKIIILVDEEGEDIQDEDWLRAASGNEALGFLKEPEEDIYSLSDGSPFSDEV